MTFIQSIKHIFRKPTPAEVVASELADAELARLADHAAQEYAQAMVGYQDVRIKRLKAFLKSKGDGQ